MSVFDIIALPFNNKPHIILAIIHRRESLTLDSRACFCPKFAPSVALSREPEHYPNSAVRMLLKVPRRLLVISSIDFSSAAPVEFLSTR